MSRSVQPRRHGGGGRGSIGARRVRSAGVLAQRALFEAFISPGFYLALSLGLLVGYLLTSGFVRAVDSSGLNFELSALYALLNRTLSGAFGAAFVDKLFAEGPHQLAIFGAFVPVAAYLLIGSVYRSGFEKNVGAVQLIAYGPADGTSYALAALARDIVLTATALGCLALFLWASALVHNTVLGPSFFAYLVLLFLAAAALYSYGLLAVAAVDSGGGALALFSVVFAVFAAIHVASFAIISGYAATLTTVFAAVLQWISPFYYLARGLDAAQSDNALLYLASIGLLGALTVAVFGATHLTLRLRGVRA